MSKSENPPVKNINSIGTEINVVHVFAEWYAKAHTKAFTFEGRFTRYNCAACVKLLKTYNLLSAAVQRYSLGTAYPGFRRIKRLGLVVHVQMARCVPQILKLCT